jgi:serine protease Do
MHCSKLALFTLLIASGVQASAPPININLPDLVEKVLSSVVNVSSTQIRSYQVYGMDDFLNMWGVPQERKQKQTSLGSGFIINKDGYVLTNNHVVEHASEVEITLLDKRQFRAKIIGTDEKMDLALLQIRDKNSAVPSNLSSVTLGDSDAKVFLPSEILLAFSTQ